MIKHKKNFLLKYIFFCVSFFAFLDMPLADEEVYTYGYTGNYETFIVPYTGIYKLEVWGAAGGGQRQLSESGLGGIGGYATGTVKLSAGERLYIYVGGEGKACNNNVCKVAGGWNGGGQGWKRTSGGANPGTSGGGATDIRLVPGDWNNTASLLSRFIVAGGGGGGGVDGEHGGDGGGFEGYSYSTSWGAAGTQTSGWALGEGFPAKEETLSYINSTYGGMGGGGGWYGGMPSKGAMYHGAGGGSGFVLTEETVLYAPHGYSVSSRYFLEETQLISGNRPVPSRTGGGITTTQQGNGYAKISLVQKLSPIEFGEMPISSNNLELQPFYKDGQINFEVVLPSNSFETELSYNTGDYIWGYNFGTTTLTVGKPHEVVLMDEQGEITIYTIFPTGGKAKINDISIDGVDIFFDPDIYNYSYQTAHSVDGFNPTIEVDPGITYQISTNHLNVGDNKITILVTGTNLESTTYTFTIYRDFYATAGKQVETFEYNGDNENEPKYQVFEAPYTSEYILEVWGAQGGGQHQNSELGVGGTGGYSKGTIKLNKGDKLYVYVGGEGSWCGGRVCVVDGGWNGGGSGYKNRSSSIDPAASGGGATDIRLVSGDWDNTASLNSRLIVAGGGGGGGMDGEPGGQGGGLQGYVPDSRTGLPGTQTAGWAFGKGFAASPSTASYVSGGYGGPGAGGGWYGGYQPRGSGWCGAGGGSGFVWTAATASSAPSGFSLTSANYLKDTITIAGNEAVPTYDGQSTMLGNRGNGHAQISYYGGEELDEVTSLTVDKGELSQEFKATDTEYYLVLGIDDTEVTFDAKTKLGEGLLTGLGTYTINPGETDITIAFTDLKGSVTNYIFHVSRPASASTNIGGFKINGVLYEGFDPDEKEYEIEIPTEINLINLELIKLYPDQKIPNNGKFIYNFDVNELTETVIVESEAALANEVYKFTFKREKTSELKVLNITSATLTSRFISSVTDYDIEVANYIREIPIEAIPYFEEAKVTITENRYVAFDDKQITIKVELDGVEPTIYTLNIVRVEALLEPVSIGYDYTGNYQTFIAPASALYTLEVWGAQGGGRHQNSELGVGGAGGYSKGSVYLNANDKLYIYVGGEGSYCRTYNCVVPGGWNGGGSGWKKSNSGYDPGSSGGGATDIRFVSGAWNDAASLNSRLIVAGGGGGGGMDGEAGGAGGGLTGYKYYSTYGDGGTQTTGWAFGQGFAASPETASYVSSGYGGQGAGGGWYGGMNSKGAGWYGAGGGSGFVWTNASSKNVPSTYTVKPQYYLIDTETLAGNEKMPNYEGNNLMQGNLGNGYAKITGTPGIVGDTFLDNIIINDGDIEIDFEPWTYEYEFDLSKEHNTVKIEAIAKNSEAKITGVGDIDLIPGLNEHKIVVTTDDGASKTYTIKINKEASDDSTAKNIILRNPQVYLCGMSPAYCKYTFDSENTLYEILLPFATEKVSLEAILKSSYQKVKYYSVEKDEFDDDVRTEVEDKTFELHSGTNVIEIDVTSEDGQYTTTYVYKLRKDDAGNNNLAELTINDPAVDIDFKKDVYEYYLQVSAEYSELDLTAITENPDATKEITGNEDFKTGMNEVRVIVTAPNNNKKTYLLHVYKEQSTNTFLSSLNVVDENNDEVTLTPNFSKLLNDYTGTVPATTKSVTISAEAEVGTVRGTGTFDLKSGNNTFELNVTSESGDVSLYTVNIFKAKNNNSKLAEIKLDPQYTLDQTFDRDLLSYTMTVPNSVTKVGLKVTPEEATTTCNIKGNNNLISKSSSIVITCVAEDKSYTIYEITVNKEVSTNNYLTDIVLSTGTLNEEFDKEELNYTMTVSGNVNSITVSGIKEVSSSTLRGNGTYSLVKGENKISLVVTSESGVDKKYTITINREMNDDTTLKEVTNNQNSKVTKIEDSSLGYDYLINVQYEVNQIEIAGIPNANTSRIVGNGRYSLKTGSNNITLSVTSEKGTVQNYIVRVVRDLSSNDDLSYLFVEEGGLDPIFNETTILYNVKVANSVDEVHIEAIPEDETAKVEIIGDTTNLVVNEPRNIIVKVTAEKGNSKEYTLSITRQEATTENLSLLKLETDQGDLFPTFNPDIPNYEISVPNNVSNITITGEAIDENVKVFGLGTYNLRVGKNAIPVFVVGTDGIQKDYQIVVTRKKSSDATINTLVVKGSTLSPRFNKSTLNYTLTTSGDSLTFTTIVPSEKDTTIDVIGNKDFVTGNNTVTIRTTAPDGETQLDYVLTVIKEASKNNNLAKLEVDGHTLAPIFHKAITFYVATVPNDLNSVIINAEAEDSQSTVEGTGLKTLSTGENYFDIIVTSGMGTTKKYTVLVAKDASDNNFLSSLMISEGDLWPDFDKNMLDYTVTVPYNVDTIDVNGTLEDINATTNSFKTYNLNEGKNDIPITVVSESGEVRIYNLVVTKEPTISPYLKTLEAKGQDLDPEFNSELTEYYIVVNNEVTSLDLEYTTIDKNADVEVIGNENFDIGMNEVHIIVTASDGEEVDYVIYVNRQLSSNNFLSSLTVGNYDLTPDFDPEVLVYNVTVPRDVEKVKVSATTQDSSAVITSGVKEHNLNLGMNVVEIKVRSSIGITRTYKVNINRQASTNNYLQDIIISNLGTNLNLTPNFDKLTNEYNITAPNDLNFVNIKTILEDEFATVTGNGTKALVTGVNKFDIVVTAEDGSDNTYTLNITKEVSDNNYLEHLHPSAGTINPRFDKETLEYVLNLTYDQSDLSFELIPESNTATVTGGDLQLVSDGQSTRIITVTAENGGVRTYTVTVNKETAAEARLETLAIKGYEFDFDPDTFTYDIQVSASKKQLLQSEITAIAKDSEAIVNMMGDMTLHDGIINIYTIEVIAKDGYTTQEYKLNITCDSTVYTLINPTFNIEREKGYIVGMEPNFKLENFIKTFENDEEMIKFYDSDNNVIEDLTKVTSTKIKIKLEKNEYIYDELRIIVLGDVNGDGRVNVLDEAMITNHILKNKLLVNDEFIAGDINADGKINVLDEAQITNYILKNIKSLNKKA